jgi:hypothetical protein
MSEVNKKKFLIGYALNAKKLRKSNVTNTSAVISSPLEGTNSSGNSHSNEKEKSKVWRGGGLADILLDSTDSDQLQFQAWDPDKSPEEQPRFDVIIHKLTEDLEREESTEKLNKLNRYLQYHQILLLDPLDAVKRVTSRARTCLQLAEIQSQYISSTISPTISTKLCPFSQPKFVIIQRTDTLSQIINKLEKHYLSFPFICKPIIACGHSLAHTFAVIVHTKDLHLLLERDWILQEYLDHGNVFYKVYMIDQTITYYQRTSLPDLASVPCDQQSSLIFDTQKSYPTLNMFLRNQDTSNDNNSNNNSSNSNTNDTFPVQINTTAPHNIERNNHTSTLLSSPTTTAAAALPQAIPTVTDAIASPSWKIPTQPIHSPIIISTTTTPPNASSMLDTSSTKDIPILLPTPPLKDSVDSITSNEKDFKSELCHTKSPSHQQQQQQSKRQKLKQQKQQQKQQKREEKFKETAQLIAQHFQLSLFGFDVLIVSNLSPSTNASSSSSSSSTQSSRRSSNQPLKQSDQLSPQISLDHVCLATAEGEEEELEEDDDNNNEEEEEEEIYVVDVNYFPSYKELGDFPTRLRNYLYKLAEKSQQQRIKSQHPHCLNDSALVSTITSTSATVISNEIDTNSDPLIIEKI